MTLLLGLGAEHEDVRGAESVVGGNGQGHRGIDAGQFLDADAVLDGRHAGAAVAIRDLDAHQPLRGEAGGEFRREVLSLVPLHHVRQDFALSELPHRAPDHLVLLGRSEVHRLVPDHRRPSAEALAQLVCGAWLSTSHPRISSP